MRFHFERKAVLMLLVVLLVAISAGCVGGGGTQDFTDPSNSASKAQGSKTKPIPILEVYPEEGGVPLLARIIGSNSYDPDGEIVKSEINFSDKHDGKGGWHDFTETQGDAWHTYEHPGTQVVHLRVTDNDGNTATEKVKIKVRHDLNAAPVAIGDAVIVEGVAALTVSFDAEGSYDPDGDIVKWEWEFVPGEGWEDYTATEGVAEYAYDAVQEWAPRLRVTDDDGASTEVEVPIYEVLFTEEYDPAAGLRIDLGDGSWLYFPPEMLETTATVSVYEGHKYAPWEFYVTEPVRVEITLADGSEAVAGTEYEYVYDTSFGYTEDFDLMYFNATNGEEPYPMFGWSQPDENGRLVKVDGYNNHQHISVLEKPIAEESKSPSSDWWYQGLRYSETEDLDKPIHVIFVHGIDILGDYFGSGLPGRSDHWEAYVPNDNPYRILEAIEPESKQDEIAVGWFYYNTVSLPIFGILSSGRQLANALEDEVFSNNQHAQVVLVGYSMGGTLIRSAYHELASRGESEHIVGVITLDGVNNGTEWVNYALTGSRIGWFGVPDTPGARDLRSIYDIKHPLMATWPPFNYTNNANRPLYNIVSNPRYQEDLWDTDCYIKLGSGKIHGFTGSSGEIKDFLTWNKFVFNGITSLRALDETRTELEYDQCFLQPTTAYMALHDGIVSSGSQFAVEFDNIDFYLNYNGSDGVGWWHEYDHIEVLDGQDDVDAKLQEAIAYIVSKIPIQSGPRPTRGVWWMHGKDAQHTGQSDDYGPTSANLAWSYDFGTQLSDSPVLDSNNNVYLTTGGYGAEEGYLYALSKNGVLLWSRQLANRTFGDPAIAENGDVCVGVWDYDIGLASYTPFGELEWDCQVWGLGQLTIADNGWIYSPVGDNGYINAVDESGNFQWYAQTSDSEYGYTSRIAIGGGGELLVGGDSGLLSALDPNTGDVVWQQQLGYNEVTDPCIGDDGSIYVVRNIGRAEGSYFSHMYALDSSGDPIWDVPVLLDGVAYASPTISDDGMLYIHVDMNDRGRAYLYSINTNGSVKWVREASGTSEGGNKVTVDADGTVFWVDNETLYALNPDNTIEWSCYMDGVYLSNPVIGSDGTLFIVDRWNGVMYAFRD